MYVRSSKNNGVDKCIQQVRGRLTATKYTLFVAYLESVMMITALLAGG